MLARKLFGALSRNLPSSTWILAVVIVVACPCAAQDRSDWSGWRGREAQGSVDSAGPSSWSPTEGVRWRTELPGRGHSSPVVAGDKVIVTTSYPVRPMQLVRRVALTSTFGIGVIATLLLGGLCVGAMRRGSNRVGVRLSAAFVICLLLGLFLVALWRPVYKTADDHVSRYILWVNSHLAVAVGLALAASRWTFGSWWRRLSGVLLLALSGSFIYLRPGPDYYTIAGGLIAGGELRDHVVPTYTTVAVLLYLAAVIPGGTRGRGVHAPSRARRVLGLATQPRTVHLLGACGIVAALMMMADRGLFAAPPHNPFLKLESIWAATFLAGAVLWTTVGDRGRTFGWSSVPAWLPGVMLVLPLLSLVFTHVLGARETLARAIVCVNRQDGSFEWTRTGLYGPKEIIHRDNTAATPTPVIDGGRVYAYFGSAGVMCTDLGGDLLWSRDDLPYEGVHGVGASPVAGNGLLVITSANAKQPYIAALNATTGDLVWRTALRGWPGVHGEHRTPTLVSIGGTRAILYWCHAHGELLALDLDRGDLLWKWKVASLRGGQAIADVLVDDRRIYLANMSGCLALSIPEVPTEIPTEVWRVDLEGRGPNTASPVLARGLLFMVSDTGRASCVDPENGRLLWQVRLPRGRYYASPIAMGGQVYFWNTSGTTTVMACERVASMIAENSLPAQLFASPAPSHGQLLVRTTQALWCIE